MKRKTVILLTIAVILIAAVLGSVCGRLVLDHII